MHSSSAPGVRAGLFATFSAAGMTIRSTAQALLGRCPGSRIRACGEMVALAALAAAIGRFFELSGLPCALEIWHDVGECRQTKGKITISHKGVSPCND